MRGESSALGNQQQPKSYCCRQKNRIQSGADRVGLDKAGTALAFRATCAERHAEAHYVKKGQRPMHTMGHRSERLAQEETITVTEARDFVIYDWLKSGDVSPLAYWLLDGHEPGDLIRRTLGR